LNKRNAKKNRTGDYQERGFMFLAEFKTPPTPSDTDKLLDAFLEFIESRGLVAAMGSKEEGQSLGWNGTICREKRYESTSAEDKTEVLKWLLSSGAIAEKTATSPDVDLWHDLKRANEIEKNPTEENGWTFGPSQPDVQAGRNLGFPSRDRRGKRNRGKKRSSLFKEA
jgi:uncharacterized protein YggL (DUF469 family)